MLSSITTLAIHWNVDPVMFHIKLSGLLSYILSIAITFVLGYIILGESSYKKHRTVFIIAAAVVGLFLGYLISPHLHSFDLRYYSLCFLIAFLLGYCIIRWMFKKESVSEEYLESLLIYIFLAVLVGARLGHCLFYEPTYFLTSKHWVEIFWPFHNGEFTGYQGLASHGAAIGIIIALCLYWKRYRLNPWWFLDRLVIVVALGGAFIRLGNLFNSEIYGVETSLPWGFIYERNGETLPKHPTQLYESLCYLIIFAVSLIYYTKKKGKFPTGSIFGWWLVALFGARLLIEFVKNDQEDFEAGMILNMGQILSLPFIIGGLVIAWLAHKNKLPQGPFPKGELTKNQKEKK